MNERDFHLQYMAPLPPGPAPLLLQLWASYHVVTELYDQRVCSSRDEHGIAMPTTAWDRSQSTVYARSVWRAVRDYARASGFSIEQINAAAREVKRWPYPHCEHYVNQHGLITLIGLRPPEPTALLWDAPL